MPAVARRLAAEALGTAFLLMAVVGSGIMAERLAGGNAAIALLANTIATGAALMVLIAIFAPLSGAHFNPAVTLVMAARRQMPLALALAYVLVQVVAAIAGVWLAHAMFAAPVLEASRHLRDGPAQWLSEFIATFGLLATILGASALKPAVTSLQVGALVGLYITAAYWFTASTSFANPAVTLARALTDSFSGIAPISVPGFLVAQFAGALAASALFNWLLAPRATPSQM